MFDRLLLLLLDPRCERLLLHVGRRPIVRVLLQHHPRHVLRDGTKRIRNPIQRLPVPGRKETRKRQRHATSRNLPKRIPHLGHIRLLQHRRPARHPPLRPRHPQRRHLRQTPIRLVIPANRPERPGQHGDKLPRPRPRLRLHLPKRRIPRRARPDIIPHRPRRINTITHQIHPDAPHLLQTGLPPPPDRHIPERDIPPRRDRPPKTPIARSPAPLVIPHFHIIHRGRDRRAGSTLFARGGVVGEEDGGKVVVQVSVVRGGDGARCAEGARVLGHGVPEEAIAGGAGAVV